MESIKIFTLDKDTVIQTTIDELQSLYAQGYGDGSWDSLSDEPITIKGEIIERQNASSRV